MKFAISALLAALAVLAPASAGATNLDGVFPRAKQMCYAAKARPGSTRAISMIRLNRPVRLHQHDTRTARVVRVVINFTGEGNLRLEDSVLCKADSGRLLCQSTSCEGTGFTLTQDKSGVLLLEQEAMAPNVIWSCERDELRNIVLTDDELTLALRVGTGSCLD